MSDAHPTTDDRLPDGNRRPKGTSTLVDLGWAVARIKRDWYFNATPEGQQWQPLTVLTIVSPSDYTEEYSQPAASVAVSINSEQAKALAEALRHD